MTDSDLAILAALERYNRSTITLLTQIIGRLLKFVLEVTSQRVNVYNETSKLIVEKTESRNAVDGARLRSISEIAIRARLWKLDSLKSKLRQFDIKLAAAVLGAPAKELCLESGDTLASVINQTIIEIDAITAIAGMAGLQIDPELVTEAADKCRGSGEAKLNRLKVEITEYIVSKTKELDQQYETLVRECSDKTLSPEILGTLTQEKRRIESYIDNLCKLTIG